MPLVNLELFKKHARIDPYGLDDDLLLHYLDAAERHVELYTQRPRGELLTGPDGTLPPDLQQAVLLLAAAYVRTPEAADNLQAAPVPYGLEALLKPYRRLTHGGEEAGGQEGGTP